VALIFPVIENTLLSLQLTWRTLSGQTDRETQLHNKIRE